jgi:ATP-dependent Lon protease
LHNFVRFCEAVVRGGTVQHIRLVTSCDDEEQWTETRARLGELRQSLIDVGVELEVAANPVLHDREIRLDNGWVIKIGRGLDFYQKPLGWYEIGAHDLTQRRCLETKVDIFRG